MTAPSRTLVWDGAIGRTAAPRPRPGGPPPRNRAAVLGSAAFGTELRRLRRARRRSQYALGAATGCDRGHLSRVEAGTRLPSLPLLGRIAAALELTDAESAGLVRLAGGADS